MIGGARFCRTCGYNNHPYSPDFCHRLKKQTAQIAIENLKTAIIGIGLTPNDREVINNVVRLMSYSVSIPEESIYNKINITEEFLTKNDLFPELKWNPTPEQIEKASAHLDYIALVINEQGKMTTDKEEKFKSAVKNIKEILKP